MKKLITITLFALCASLSIIAQPADEKPVQILRGISNKSWQCRQAVKAADTSKAPDPHQAGECPEVKALNVDPAKETLVTFGASGDCHVQAMVKITRNDKEKAYKIHTTTLYGGCRAAGRYNGWAVIEKIPADYRIIRSSSQAEKGDLSILEEERAFNHSMNRWVAKYLSIEPYDIKGCLSLRKWEKVVVDDQPTLDRYLTEQNSRRSCKSDLPKIDFSQKMLVGMFFTSGYCRKPTGLREVLMDNVREKEFVVLGAYIKPQGICRHMGGYDMWAVVPKLPAGYSIRFEPFPMEKEIYDSFLSDVEKSGVEKIKRGQ